MIGISIPAPTGTTEAPTITKAHIDRIDRAHDAVAAALGCNHLPARPGTIHADDKTAAAHLQREAVATADALKRWRPATAHPCRHASTDLVPHLSHTWSALARVLSAQSLGITRHLTLAERALAARLNKVETRTTELIERITWARGFAEPATGLVKLAFDRAAKAGCVHIPATVTSARLPTNLAALQRLQDTAWRVHEAIAPAIHPTYDDPDNHDVKPTECCGALAATPARPSSKWSADGSALSTQQPCTPPTAKPTARAAPRAR